MMIMDSIDDNDDIDERLFHTRICQGILLLSPIVAIILVLGKPPTYGKLQQQQPPKQPQQRTDNGNVTSSSNSSWTWTYFGPLIPSRIAWMIFESPCLIWVIVCLYWRKMEIQQNNINIDESVPFGSSSSSSSSLLSLLSLQLPMGNTILLIWFTIHYIYRSIIYPLRQSTTSQTPIGIAFMAWSYCMCNGYVQARSLTAVITTSDEHPLSNDNNNAFGMEINTNCVSFGIGMTMCIIGFWIVYTSDQILLRLKKKKQKRNNHNNDQQSSSSSSNSNSNSTNRYSIPYGGLFEVVSAPHYLGEIVEWTGFWIASSSGGFSFHRNWASLSFVIWTACNLIPRAIHTHQWYQQTFDGGRSSRAKKKKNDDDDTTISSSSADDDMLLLYPPNRKIIFPFIF